MNVKPIIAYNVDKLDLVFSITEDFQFPDTIEVMKIPEVSEDIPLEEIQLWNVNPIIPVYIVFIFKTGMPMEGKFTKKNPPVELYCDIAGNSYYIGKFHTHLQDGLKLEVDNEFLYSPYLKYLSLLENNLNITLSRISNFDVCADSNQNLPRKLNDTLHSSNCMVTRPGSKISSWKTEKGNMKLGYKISKNIKILTTTEYNDPTFIYDLNGSTSKKIRLVGYNKKKEIEETRSKKKYIMESLPFTGSIYRFELRFQSQYLTAQSKDSKKGWSLRYIFEHLHDEIFLKEFFITHINRFYNLKIKNQKVKISELLRLE